MVITKKKLKKRNNDTSFSSPSATRRVEMITFNMKISTAETETNWNATEFLNVSWHKVTAITNNCFNSTEQDEDNFLAIVPLICGIVMTGTTFVGQVVVFIVIWNDKRLRRPHNYYIISLAITDFLISTISMPIWTTYSTLGIITILNFSCYIWMNKIHCRMQNPHLTK